MHVKLRLMGDADEVARVAAALKGVLEVERESENYANRKGEGVRRYLEVSMKGVPDPRSNEDDG